MALLEDDASYFDEHMADLDDADLRARERLRLLTWPMLARGATPAGSAFEPNSGPR